MPHGPAKAVFVPAAAQTHGPSPSFGGAGIFSDSGWPERSRDGSGSGPLGPIFQGVWQSLQPPSWTRYAPRLIFACAASFACSFAFFAAFRLEAVAPIEAARARLPMMTTMAVMR